MAHVPHVIVQPPSPTGGRTVRVDGTILGTAYGPSDLREFLRRAVVPVRNPSCRSIVILPPSRRRHLPRRGSPRPSA
ncbi:hypothetical protein LUV28_32205 [Streptomyces sp. 8ZJF_21]|nr:hypothetical protein [Streptomyces sp. 8ZJF_21]MCD9592435.1 hypothetical protein [Streptomyces sp. 8ZJF_21]